MKKRFLTGTFLTILFVLIYGIALAGGTEFRNVSPENGETRNGDTFSCNYDGLDHGVKFTLVTYNSYETMDKTSFATISDSSYAKRDGENYPYKAYYENGYLHFLLESPDVGTYSIFIYASWSDGRYSYYDSHYYTLQISPGQLSELITVEGYSGTYDGENHNGAAVSVNGDPGEYTVLYKTAQDAEYSSVVPSLKNVADTGTVYYQVTCANANLESGVYESSVEASVSPRPATLVPDDQHKCIGDPDPEWTYTVDGIVQGETLEGITVSRITGETAGIYTIAAAAENGMNHNYTVETGSGTFTITEHDWDTPVYTWNTDNSQVTAVCVCQYNQRHTITETVMAIAAITKQPDCTTPGETTYTTEPFQNACFLIQEKTEENIPALGHSVVIDEYVAPTGDTDGLTEGSHCSVCGAIIKAQEIIPKEAVCGDHLSWNISDGILTIYGTGSMYDYTGYGSPRIPWYDQKDEITEVVIRNGVTTIGRSAFWHCTQLTKVTVPESIADIRAYAFMGCSSLEDLNLPDNLNSLGESVFSACSNLKSISLSDNVTQIDSMAFDGWYGTIYAERNSAAAMIVSQQYRNFHEPDTNFSLIYTFEGDTITGLSLSEVDDKEITEFVFPDYINAIGYGAFRNCSKLVSLTIPEYVKTLGNAMFSGCTSLRELNIPGVLANTDYGITAEFFTGCYTIERLNIPGSLAEAVMGHEAGEYLANLESVTIHDPEHGYFSIDGVIFETGEKPFLMMCPKGRQGEYVIPEGTGGISDISGFQNCKKLTKISIPSSLTYLPMGMRGPFDNCTSLSTIEVDPANPDFASEDGVLFGKNKSTLVCYPYNRSGRYTVPESVTKIGYNAFYYCRQMTGITLPGNLTEIDSNAFYGSGLTEITIPEGVTTIGSSAFGYCGELTKVTIPNTVKEIGDMAFDSCGKITNITLPYGMTKISSGLFMYCSNLTRVTIPESVVSVAGSAFSECRNLTDVNFNGTEEQWNNISISSYGNQYLLNATKHYHTHIWSRSYTWDEDNLHVTGMRKCYCGSMETETAAVSAVITREPTCTEEGETTYTSDAFENSAFEVQSKVLRDVAALGHDWGTPFYVWAEDNRSVTAARRCRRDDEHQETETAVAASAIQTPPTEEREGSVNYIAVFMNAAYEEQTKTVAIPSLRDMNVLRLPGDLKVIEEEAFIGVACEAVIIPDGCTKIGTRAFADCDGLKYVRIPKSVTTIAEDAFDGDAAAILDYEKPATR